MQVNLSQLMPEALAIIGILSDQFHGQITAFITNNPKVAMIAAVVAFIANKFATPPTAASAPVTPTTQP